MTFSVQDQLRLEKKSMLLLPIFITVLKRGIQRFNFICTISYIKKHYSLLSVSRFVDLQYKELSWSHEGSPGKHCPFSSDQPDTTAFGQINVD